LGSDPKNVNTPVHGIDVVHSGSGGFVGFVDDDSFVGEGDVDGVAEGFAEGADGLDGSAMAWIVGMDEGLDDVDGSADGVDDHDEVKGSQMILVRSLLDPYVLVLK